MSKSKTNKNMQWLCVSVIITYDYIITNNIIIIIIVIS